MNKDWVDKELTLNKAFPNSTIKLQINIKKVKEATQNGDNRDSVISGISISDDEESKDDILPSAVE